MESLLKIDRIKFLLTRSQLFEPEDYDQEIWKLLLSIFDDLAAATYEESYQTRLGLYECSEQFHNLFFSNLFLIHEQQLKELRSSTIISTPTGPEDDGQELPRPLLFDIFKFVLENNDSIKLSSVNLPPLKYSKDTLLQLLLLLIHVVQHDAASLQWSREEIRINVTLLAIVRKISIELNRPHIFYALAGVVVERLNISEEYQFCRDFGEEILLTSIIDEQVGWGYMTLFKVFNGQTNTNMALLYANCTLAALRRGSYVFDSILKALLFSLQRLYRNTGFDADEKSLYESMLKSLPLDDFEYFDITNSHLMTLAAHQDSSAVTALFEYLTEKREFLLQDRKSVALPMLNTAYHIKRIFPDNPTIAALDPIVTRLEAIVGQRDVSRLKTLVHGESGSLKEIYIDQLLTLEETRSAEDFVSEVRRPLVTADHLVKFGLDNQDVNAFLLGMILKSDRSWMFQEKEAGTPFLAERLNHSETAVDHFKHYSEHIRNRLAITSGEVCLWLANWAGQVLCLTLTSQGFSRIVALSNWRTTTMQTWLSKGFTDLVFDTLVWKHGQLESYLEEDQLQDLRKVKAALNFAKIDVPLEADNLLVIKDMAIAGMPHNLMIDASGDFISLTKGICCLPSAEWWVAARENKESLRKTFTTELWIPTQGGDFTLNLLATKLNDSIKGFDVRITNEEVPKVPLAGDINILSAHGSEDISSFHALFTRDEASIVNLERIVGLGSVIILFVCHSGSAEKDVLRQKLISLVRMFISNGYKAAIAPFWTMHISIPLYGCQSS